MSCIQPIAELAIGFHQAVKGEHVAALITGVGITATAYQMGRILAAHPFDLAVNIGLAGSFSKSLPPESVVEVVREEFGDLGAEDHDQFIDIFGLGLQERNSFPFKDGFLFPLESGVNIMNISKVKGSTVHTVHGSEKSISAFTERSDAEVESMEGAAFFYACNQAGIPSLQIRAISNFVEPRNRETWKVKEALKALQQFLEKNWLQITTSY